MVDRLIAGVARFAQDVMPGKAELFAKLAEAQAPTTLFVTCADSRLDPSLITQTEPGELFLVRNAGNIVPLLDDTGSLCDGTAASIEFAVAVLHVSDIVVCGHSGCGAMANLLRPTEEKSLPSIGRWLEQSSELVAADADITNDELIDQNVLLQLEHLRTYPVVSNALAAGRVKLHAWVYDIGSGHVRAHNGEEFVDLTELN